jgi:hypothetical protein
MKASAWIRLYSSAVALVLFAAASSPLAAQPAPIASYPFNGSATDATGNGHNGTVVGAQPTVDRFGNAKSAFAFDGNDYIEVPHASDLAFGTASIFTINAWVQVCRRQSDFAGIVAKGPSGTHYPGYQFFVHGNAVAGETGLSNGSFMRVIGSTPLSDGRWHMLTFVLSTADNQISVFLDGRLEGINRSDGISPSMGFEAPLFIGHERNADVYFTGAIDDVRIYRSALTVSELATLFVEDGWDGTTPGNGETLTLRSLDGTTICRGDSVRLAAGGAEGLQWSPASGLSSTTGSNVVARPTRTTTYTVRGAAAGNCDVAQSKSITIEVIGPLASAGLPRASCIGSTVTIGAPATEGKPPYVYRWSPAELVSDAAIATPTITVDQTRMYYVTVTDGSGCSNTDSVRIEALPQPVLELNDTSFCSGTNGVVIGSPASSGTPPMTYRWRPSTGLSNDAVAQPRARPAATTRYEVTVTDAEGCTTTGTVNVTVKPQVTLDAGGDKVICANDTVMIGRPVSPGLQIVWSPADGLSDPTSPQPIASPAFTTVYIATVLDPVGGCSATDSVVVTVLHTTVAIGGPQDYGVHLPELEIDNEHAITNTSVTPITVDSITIASPFEILATSRSLPCTLLPGEFIRVRVRYAAEPGVQRRALRVFISAPCVVASELDLQGSGDDRALAVVRVEDFSGPAGAHLRMRLVLDSAIALDRAGAQLFTATVAFDRTLLYPADERTMRADSAMRRIDIEGAWIGTSHVLAEVDMTAMLGHAESTPLLLESFEWIAPKSPIPTRTIDGVFTLDSVCGDGGKRLIEPGVRTLLRAVTPHPVSTTARVVYVLEEAGPARLSIVDQLGNEVMKIFDEEFRPGTGEASLDVTSLPSGAYLLLLRTATRMVTTPLEVTR